jgi:hypothetical protein
MNAARFRQLVAEAITSRQPLETEDFARLAEETGEEMFLRSQIDLDHAIRAWKAHARPNRRGRFVTRRASAWIATIAAGVSAIWLAQTIGPAAPEVRSEASTTTATIDVSVTSVPAVAELWPRAPIVAPKPVQDHRLAEATATAERLAYAFQPVGEQVSSVVRLLMDAVPGSEVFAL